MNGEYEYEGFEVLLCDEFVIFLTTRFFARVEERGEVKFLVKMVLSVYMICYYVDVVFGGLNVKEVLCEEMLFIDLFKVLVNVFDAFVFTMSRSGTFIVIIMNVFECVWYMWIVDFKIWKLKDVFSLI